MKKLLSVLFVVLSFTASSQDTSAVKTTEMSADLNAYFLRDDFILIPVFKLDRSALHLEARYNYEDDKTFSAWAGYNIEGGNNLEYKFTPMAGVVTGTTDGFAAGLEITLDYKNFSFSSESEYLFDNADTENNFFYSFNDLSYTVQDKVWFGLSSQRTRIYQTDLDFSAGIFSGGEIGNWEINAYLFNLVIDEPFAVLVVSYSF